MAPPLFLVTSPRETSPSPAEAGAARTGFYRVGSLAYSPATLRRLFLLLLGGDLVFTLVDQIEPKVLPIILKQHGATDTQIAIIVSSITAVVQLVVMPVVSYRSDRLRSRWGRRIPYLIWATPFVSLLLALTPFAPDIVRHVSGTGWLTEVCRQWQVLPVILAFAVLTVGYRIALSITSAIFFALFRDVVPMSHMGRFLALFRIVGALATFAITYWLVGLAETHAKPIFIGLAVLNLIGFAAMCLLVKEGEYPPVVAPAGCGPGAGGLLAGVRTFFRECFTHPIYRWMYLARTAIFSAISASAFLVFFPQRELGMSFDQVGKYMSWPALAWLLLAYPVGRWVDRFGAIPVLAVSLAVTTAGYIAAFFLATGPTTFLLTFLVSGLAGWAVMLTQTAAGQAVFRPERFAQLGSAAVLVQSLAITLVVSPFIGWLLGVLSGSAIHLGFASWHLEAGAYRFVNLLMAACYAVALFSLYQVRRWWLFFGGPKAYQAPL